MQVKYRVMLPPNSIRQIQKVRERRGPGQGKREREGDLGKIYWGLDRGRVKLELGKGAEDEGDMEGGEGAER